MEGDCPAFVGAVLTGSLPILGGPSNYGCTPFRTFPNTELGLPQGLVLQSTAPLLPCWALGKITGSCICTRHLANNDLERSRSSIIPQPRQNAGDWQ